MAVEVLDDSAIDQPMGERQVVEENCQISLVRGHDAQTFPVQYRIDGSLREVVGPGSPDGLRVQGQTGAGLRRYEWRVDLGQAGPDARPLRAGQVLGFDVAVGDRDEDGSASWMAWGRRGRRGPGKDHADALGDLALAGADEPTGVIHGRLRWAGVPEGAGRGQVRIQSLSEEGWWLDALAGTHGDYSTEGPAGRYRVTLTVPGGAQEGRGLEVPAGRRVEADLEARPPEGRVRPAGPGRGFWQTLDVTDGLPSVWIRDLRQDRQGNLWIAALAGGGLSRRPWPSGSTPTWRCATWTR